MRVAMYLGSRGLSAVKTSRGVFSNLGSHRHYGEMVNTLQASLDWKDRIGLQNRYTLSEKGWLVQVNWRPTPYGAGVFANEDISKGTILRKGILGVNLHEFTSSEAIDAFCQNNKDKRDYVKDYLYGSHRNEDRFFGMWVPGNGLNHNEIPNTIYQETPEGIDLVALTDIAKDDELYDDYRRHGKAPEWLKVYAETHNVTLVFADCNDFV